MKAVKTLWDEVFGNDPNSPFWQRIDAEAKRTGFYEEIEHIMTQSQKYGKPYVDLTEKERND